MRRFSTVLLALLLAHSGARACSVPVFRYALEHWEPDPYRLTLFHRGPLAPDQRRMLEPDPKANLRVTAVNLDEEKDPAVLKLWQDAGAGQVPRLVLQYPRISGIEKPVAGDFQPGHLDALIESPARKEITRRLSEGESAVWVLLESGDAERDAAAADLVTKRLEYLAGVMALPQLDQQDIIKGLVSIAEEDLRLAFSILRVSRKDPAEAALTQMLLGTEPDLHELPHPMVFPVFGRGRVLYALVGAGIRAEMIDEAAEFLIGKCSCQVKELNPGVDLLLRADWPRIIEATSETARDLPTLSQITAAEPVAVTTTPQAPAPAGSPSSRHPFWLLAVLYGVSPLLSAVAILLIWRKKKSAR